MSTSASNNHSSASNSSLVTSSLSGDCKSMGPDGSPGSPDLSWLRIVLDNLPHRIFIKNRQSDYLLCNNQLARDYGIAADDVAGRNDLDFLPRELAEKYRADDQRIMDAGVPEDLVEDYVVSDSIRSIHTQKVPLLGVDGHAWGILGIFYDISEQKGLERALKSSERRFRDAFEHGPIGMALLDREARFSKVNLRMCAIFGYERAELEDRTVDDLLAPDARPQGEIVDHLLNRKSHEAAIPLQCVRSDGATVWVRTSCVAQYDDQGALTQIILQMEDVTDQRRAMESIRLLAAAIEHAGDSVIVCDIDHRIQYVNPSFTRVTGYSADEVVGQPSSILRSKRLAPDFYESIWASVGNGSIWSGRVTNARKDGTDYHAELTFSPIRDDRGRVVQYVGVQRDITEQIQFEQKMKEAFDKVERSHRENALILRAVSAALIRTDALGRVLLWNEPAERLFGIPQGDICGRRFWDCPIPWDWDELRAHVETCRASRGTVNLKEFKCCDCEDNGRYLDLMIAPVIEDDNKESGFLLHCIDVTDQRLLQMQLTQALKLESIGQLSAGIAHEINTPTQYVGDNLRFLQEATEELSQLLVIHEQIVDIAEQADVATELTATSRRLEKELDIDYLKEEIPRAIEQALEGVSRVAKIVRSMKEFSHPGSTEKSEINLNHAIETTLTVCRNEWKYVAEIQLDLETDMAPVACLPGELNQTILNMVVNASHAIAEKLGPNPTSLGTIRIQTRTDGDWVEIRIADSGMGIPKAIRHRVFDPFFTTKQVGKGTGQGLAMTHSVIVDKHQGTIDVESREGEGATFIVRIPRRSIPAETEVAS